MISIIGKGFVGGAVYDGFKKRLPCKSIIAYDKATGWHGAVFFGPAKPPTGNPYKFILQQHPDAVFVCVPTPMIKATGECDTSIVEFVVSELDQAAVKLGVSHPVIAIKSTVTPGTTDRLNQTYKHVSCVFNPEFLRESSALDDFLNQDRIIIGGPSEARQRVFNLYAETFPNVPIYLTHSNTAEMVKYVTNAMLSVKVACCNQLYTLCTKNNLDYAEVAELAKLDKRLGDSHWQVPGPDGQRGFGKKCLPKDLNGLIAMAYGHIDDVSIFDETWHYNLVVRKDHDWENIEGAVSQ